MLDVIQLFQCGKSLTKIRNSSGPRTEPWGMSLHTYGTSGLKSVVITSLSAFYLRYSKQDTVVIVCRETENTFSTIFGSQHVRQNTGRRVFTHSHKDTHDEIFGKYLPRYIDDSYEQEDEDTFENVFGIKRQEVTPQHHC